MSFIVKLGIGLFSKFHGKKYFCTYAILRGLKMKIILLDCLAYIQICSSFQNTYHTTKFLLGPYNTIVFPYYYCHCSPSLLLLCPFCPHLFIIVSHISPLLLLLCHYIIIVISTLIIL